jgi:hypothetical protein
MDTHGTFYIRPPEERAALNELLALLKKGIVPNFTGIQVTQGIINSSVPCRPDLCMVKETIRLTIPGAHSVTVDGPVVYFNLGGECRTDDDQQQGESFRLCYRIPGRVRDKIEDFDNEENRKNVKPFTFSLKDGTSSVKKKLGPQIKSPHGKGKTCSKRQPPRRYNGLCMTSRDKAFTPNN